MKENLKKAIAREGLILFGFVILMLVGLFVKLTTVFDHQTKKIYFITMFVAALVYILSLLIRLIIWRLKH